MNVLEKLCQLKSNKIKSFSQKLVFTKYEILGVKLPDIRAIVKALSYNEKLEILDASLDNKYFEEILLYGFCLGSVKLEYNDFLKYFYKFLPYIDNWSVCDSCICGFKIIAKNKEKFLIEIEKLLKTDNEFYQRVAFVILMDFYILKDNLEYIFAKCDEILSNYYYVNMAKAWLISVCFIKHKEETYEYLYKDGLDDFTHNKAISKICDSFRVAKEDKLKIKTLRR